MQTTFQDKPVFTSERGMFGLIIEFKKPKEWDDLLNFKEVWDKQLPIFFRQFLFEWNRYLIRLTPMDTGRLRGGWTSFLEKYGIGYEDVFSDTSLITANARPPDQAMINEGRAMSSFAEADLFLSLTNAVPYGEYVEFGTAGSAGYNFTQRALYKAEFLLSQSLGDWLKDATFALEVPEGTVKGLTA